MYPNEWPLWLRDSIPGWVVVAALAWFSLQRYLDFRDNKSRHKVVMHGRPVRDPRILCPLIAIMAASGITLFTGPAKSSVNTQLHSVTLYGLAVVFMVGCVLTVVAAFVKSEWWSTGLELVASILLGGAFLVDAFGYGMHTEAAFLSALLCLSYVIANVLRVIQLLKRLG